MGVDGWYFFYRQLLGRHHQAPGASVSLLNARPEQRLGHERVREEQHGDP